MSEFPIPFDASIHQDTDPAVAHEGTLARVSNGRIPREGGIVKRFGVQAVSKTVAVGQAMSGRPNAIGNAQGRNIIAMGGRAYARDSSTKPGWVECGRPSSYLPIRADFLPFDETVEPATDFSPPHVATIGDTYATVYAGRDPGSGLTNTHVQLYDLAGQVIAHSTIPTALSPRVFAVGSTYVVTYEDPAGVGNVYARTLTTAGVLSAPILTIARQAGTDRYDAAAYDSTTWLLSMRTGALTMGVRLYSTAGAVVHGNNFVVANSPVLYVRVFGTAGEAIYVGWRNTAATTGLHGSGNTDLSVLTAVSAAFGTAVRQIVFTRATATSAWMVYGDVTGGTTPFVGAKLVDNTNVEVANVSQIYWLLVASAPFAGTSSGFSVWMASNPSDLPTLSRYTLVRVTWDYAQGDSLQTVLVDLTSDLEANLNAFSATTGTMVSPIVARGERLFFATANTLGQGRTVPFLYEYEDASTRRGAWRQEVDAATCGNLCGGHLQFVSKNRVNSLLNGPSARGSQSGFVLAPVVTAVISATAGSFANAGVYQICSTYEYIDTDGRIHESESGPVVVYVPGAGGQGVDVTTRLSPRTERAATNSVTAEALITYCTKNGGATFFRLSRSTTFAEVPSNQFASTATTTYINPPAGSEQQLYTSGNELRNSPSPSHRYALHSHDALWLSGLWDPRMLERSKTIQPNEPPNFTRANQFRALAPFDIAAMAELDGQIYVFGTEGVAVMSADGPNDQGVPALVNPTFLSPLGLVPGGEVGVVRIPAGIVYPGRRGLYLAPRGGGDPEFLGAPIQGDLQTVYSATEHFEPAEGSIPGSRLVAFAITNTTGISYVAQLDQDTLQWVSVDSLPVTPELLGRFGSDLVSLPLNSAASNILTRASSRSGGDLSLALSVAGETAHCRPFGLMGWGYARRVQLLMTLPVQDPAEVSGGPTILVEFARDGAPFAPLALYTPTGVGVDLAEWQLPGDQPCNSFRFRVTASAIGAGPTLHGLTVNVDPVDGLPRLVPGKRS